MLAEDRGTNVHKVHNDTRARARAFQAKVKRGPGVGLAEFGP